MHMKFPKTLPAVLLLLMGLTLEAAEPGAVLMVCEHGSVKSLMAASFFNKAAAERHLPFRAIARGVNADPAVPAPIVAALKQDGIDVSGFSPARFTEAEVAGATRVIAIGVEPTAINAGAEIPIERWSDVPAASIHYSAARDSLKEHVDALLNELQRDRDR